ncbi:unnamed protein product [Schistosoma turkestanicum]|nr:unnamed protein product [Schistosoma turkestanicum]
MSILLKTISLLIFGSISLSIQVDIGHTWNNQWELNPDVRKHQSEHQGHIVRVGSDNTVNDDLDDDDDDDDILSLFNFNQQPSYYSTKVFPSTTWDLPIDSDEDTDRLQESTSTSSSRTDEDLPDSMEYLNPYLLNLIYYSNPLKKKRDQTTTTTTTQSTDDSSMIVKKMPETEKWSTPIQPGNSNDLRKLRNLDTFNMKQ